jgi:ABC-2 type transport system permease protein
VAAVAQFPGIGEQLWLVARLRWRILRNNLRKKSSRLDIIGLIFAGLFGAVFVAGLSFAFYFGTYYFVSTGRAGWLALLFWGVFLFWQMAPLFAAGLAPGFEFRSLLRFPLNLRTFYLIGLAYGLADFAALASLAWLLSMTVGASIANPGLILPMLVVVVFFLWMNVTLERLIGSWLERILSRRRSREIFFAIFILLMVSVQFIAPLLRQYGHSARPWVIEILPYFAPFPPSLAGRTIAGAVDHEPLTILIGLTGLAAYVLLFSGLLWRRFAAQFRGEELSETTAAIRAPSRILTSQGVRRDALSFFSPQVAAVLRKEFHYLTRNGFTILLLLLPPILVLLVSSGFVDRHPSMIQNPVSHNLFFPGMMGYLVLILMAPAYNSFAYEGRGIQVYFSAPLRFREVFQGKNILLGAILVLEVALSVLVVALRIGLPSPPVFLATLVAIFFAVVGQMAIANWSSLSFPRKLEFGAMRGQRNSGMAVLISFGVQILLGSICAVILLAGGWTGDVWLPAETFAGLGAVAVGGYFASLEPLSLLAEKKKETLLEALCR